MVTPPKILFFDTETTGLPPQYGPPYKTWPHLVQMGFVLTGQNKNPFLKYSQIIQPNGWIIPEASTKIHGITHSEALAKGLPLRDVMNAFWKAWKEADLVVCHNVLFDRGIIRGVADRLGKPDIFEGKPTYCTMTQSPVIMMRGGKNGRISLAKLCENCGVKNEKAHDGLADALATYECYKYMSDNGHIFWGKPG
jgi:DNA polymerase III epsilon subunit-like protein